MLGYLARWYFPHHNKVKDAVILLITVHLSMTEKYLSMSKNLNEVVTAGHKILRTWKSVEVPTNITLRNY